MRRSIPLAVAAVLLCAAPASAVPRLTPVGTFEQPVYVAAPPGDSHRLFVVEQAGRVRVLVDGGAPQTFLDIRDEVKYGGEQGLLSIAFARDYATSGRFFVYFNAPRPGDPIGSVIRVDELYRSAGDPNAADEGRRRTLLTIQHPNRGNHNGGQLQTGPDGLLWIGTGDGGGGYDPDANGQNPRTLLGKLLRIDPDPSATAPYTIPAGNPYADGAAAAPEIWAYGLRNPWRFSFDRETGDLTIGDVGQGEREEVDFAPRGSGAGVNYGWVCMEGSQPTPNVPPCTPSGTYAPPVFDYTHSGGRCSLTGGYVSRHADLPTLRGRYVYGDYCTGELLSVVLAQPAASDDRGEPLNVPTLSSFGEDSCGHLYAMSVSGGLVFRIDDQAFTPCPEAPPGGPPGPGDDPPGADVQAPVLSVDRARRQRLLAERHVHVGARCSEVCGLTTGASIRVPSGDTTKKYVLAKRSRLVAAGERVRVKLKLPKATRARLAARMAAGLRPLAKVVLTARDAAGNETRRTVYVRAVG